VENWHFQKYSKECFTEFVGLSIKKYIFYSNKNKISLHYIKYLRAYCHENATMWKSKWSYFRV